MAKRVVKHTPEPPDPAPPIFVTLIKCKSDELVYIEYEREGLKAHVEMEDATKQRPVEEFYQNMRDLALHVLKQAELPTQRLEDIRTTGIRLKWEGSNNLPSAQLMGWFQLKMSSGGYALPLPFKTLGSHVTSQTDGEPEYPADHQPGVEGEGQEEMSLGEDGPQMADGSNRVRHSRECTRLIQRQIELTQSYIGGQRAALTIFDTDSDAPAAVEYEEDLQQTDVPELMEEVEAA